MSFRLKLFHRRREKASSPKASDDALPSGPILAETTSAKPNPQFQSLLLTLLPLDVRLLIYEHIIVVKPRLHVVDWYPHARLSHIGCEEPGNDNIRHAKCWNHRNGEGELHKPAVVKLGILQTCRLVHSEGIDFLYRQNVFDLEALSTLTTFVARVPRTSLNLIRAMNLNLFWYAWFPGSSVENLRQSTCPPAFKFQWKKACDVLIELEGLRELRVSIEFQKENWRRAGKTEGIWFEELKRVGREKGLKTFDVEVNWPGVEDTEEVDLPFNLSRLGHQNEGLDMH